ncbi:hypothetical protein [[Clostridium] fimetarium]|uniref:Uncharacterized protein n=1 Tax=[Clostridium] fimetarium TaxID=99656 RepID=A0A1I0RDR3_9FIRM|nr:hypothetical protein [[Clostridium] fimetarium]SEW38993.1 hypothetical protein SAMN05421659_11476 [[Clostridium] fimetarium]
MISLLNWTLIVAKSGGVHISYGLLEITPLIVACRVVENGMIVTVLPTELKTENEDGEYYLDFKELVLKSRPLINHFVKEYGCKIDYRTPEIVRAIYDFIAIICLEADSVGLSAINIDSCFEYYKDALPYKNIDYKGVLKAIHRSMSGE